MAFTDYMEQYFQNRMDQATRPFTDTEGYMAERLGFETEEERRKRLEREAAQRGNTEVSSTTVKSYQDGSQEQVVKTQIPAAQPQVSAPVNPADTYQRMIQAESGGRQFGPDGQVLTSPKGAMGVGQVMPATAMQPGYGVTNIFDMAEQRGMPVAQRDEATARQLLGNESLNRDFGQSYFNAMQQRFPQDPAASVAAYNAGPGRVGQNMQANAGQLNRSQLPAETQAYLQQTLGGQPPQPAPAQPQAPTQLVQEPPGTAPATGPVPPTALAQEPPAPAPVPTTDTTQPMIAGMPSSDVGLTPTEQALQDPNMQRFTAAQNDPAAMLALAQDPTAPKWVQNLAYKQVADFAKNKNEENKANQMTDPNAIAKELSRKSSDGSWVKYYLMKRLGLNEAATQEASKLGLTNTWNTYNINGKNYLVNTQADGLPIAGIDPETGKAVPASIYQQISGTSKDIQQSNDIYKDPTQATGPAFYYERRPGGVAVFKEVGTGRIASPTEATKLIKVGVAGTLPQQYEGAYGKAAYGKAGAAAGEGMIPTTIPGAPGMGTGTVPGGAPGVPTTPTVPGAPAAAGAPAPAAQPAPAVSSNTNIPNAFATPPAPAGAPTISQQRRAGEIQEKRSVAFNEIIDKEYRVDGQNGEVISENRKLQFDILNRKDPVSGKGVAEEISGIYNAANQAPGDQKLTIVRDILTGKVGKPEDRISERIADLNISPAAKSALQEYNALNAQIAGRTLRDTAGPGAVSDAEQQANRARNVDIGRAPMLGAYNMMSQSQFAGDLSRYKSDLASSSDSKSATLFERDFRKTREELVKSYREVTEARLDYINKNGGATNPAAIREGYKLFPVPQYDVSTGNWRYLKPLNKIIQ
jgi:hypothetical protein